MIINHAKNCEKSMLISSVITLLLGIILAVSPTESIHMLTSIIAIIFLLIGAFQVIDYLHQPKELKMTSLSFILGILFLCIGFYLFIKIESLVKFITILIGLTICIKSLFKIQFALNLRDISDKWKYNFIIGIIEMIMGVVLLANPFDSAVLFLRIVGILLAVGSIIEIIETLMVLRSLKDAKEIVFYDKKK